MSEEISSNLSSVEKKRNNAASISFLKGCEKFIKKCADERIKSSVQQYKIVEYKIEENKKSKENVDTNSLNKLVVILGALGVSITASIVIFQKFADKINPIASKLSAAAAGYISDFENGKDKFVNKAYNQWKGFAQTIGNMITDAVRGMSAFGGDDRFTSVSFRESGIIIPIMEKLFQLGLFWTLNKGGLSFIADLFGIQEPSLVQIKYGIFAELSKDNNAYFSDAGTERGFSGAKIQTQGLGVLERLSKGLTPSALLGDSDNSFDVDTKSFDSYIEALNKVQDKIDEGVKNGVYDMTAIQTFLGEASARADNISNLLTYAKYKEGKGLLESLGYTLSEMTDSIETRTRRGKTAVDKIIPGQTDVTLFSGKTYGYINKKEWMPINESIKYLDYQFAVIPKGVDPKMDKLREAWAAITSYAYVSNEWNLQDRHKIRWRVGSPFEIIALVPLVAEREIYHARESLVYAASYMDDYYKDSFSDNLLIAINKKLLEAKEVMDQAGNLYNLGIISLSDYLKDTWEKLNNDYFKFFKNGSYNNQVESYILNGVKSVISSGMYTMLNLYVIKENTATLRRIVANISKIGMMTLGGNSSEENMLVLGNFNERDDIAFKVSDREESETGDKTSVTDYIDTDILSTINDERLSSNQRISVLFSTNMEIDDRINEERERRYNLLVVLEKLIVENESSKKR